MSSVAQDPLSNAKARAHELERACSNVEVELLDAGHCPHDEVPHLVNKSLLNFMQKIESEQAATVTGPGTQEQPLAAA